MSGQSKICSPSLIRSVPVARSKNSVYKGRNWYARNVLGILPHVEYYDGLEAALSAAGLDDIP